ncbi:adenylate/guanylate cyclase domain-containing protein [Brevibacterium yomogidense]|uniref:adenylate/guanylate cyclase domain-containing protein n=1 Tax=Brevibacterium yomogidense TaxID=946573 RepID=UPI0018DF66D5
MKADRPATWTGSVRWADAADPAAWKRDGSPAEPGGSDVQSTQQLPPVVAEAGSPPVTALPIIPEHTATDDEPTAEKGAGAGQGAGAGPGAVAGAGAVAGPGAGTGAGAASGAGSISGTSAASSAGAAAGTAAAAGTGAAARRGASGGRDAAGGRDAVPGARGATGQEQAAGEDRARGTEPAATSAADADAGEPWAGGGDDFSDIDPPDDDPGTVADATSTEAATAEADAASAEAATEEADGAPLSDAARSEFSLRLSDDPRTGPMPEIDLHAALSEKESTAAENTIYELRTAAQHLEEVLIGGKRVLTRKEVAQLAEVSTLSARKLWRALGQPLIPEGEAAFTVSDAAPLRRVADLVSSGLVDEETALQMSRAIGQMTDRLVVWQMEAMVEYLIEEKGLSDSEARRASLDVFEDIIDPLQDLMVYAWRRNLAGALGRLNVNVEETLEIGGASRGQDPTMPLARGIGFIDLVSYTRLSQQLDSRELSRLVKRFQFLAYNIVAAGGGKVIKTVGDEVFFAAETPLAGAEIAMTLLEQVKKDGSLPRCRVGYSWGRVLSRMGDIFGTTVNLAARLTAVADPGTVVTDTETARIIERDDMFGFDNRRDLNLQGLGEIGVVEMHRLTAPTITSEDIT